MNTEMTIFQSGLFIATGLVGIATLVFALDHKKSVWLFFLPWLTVILAASWFIFTQEYYSRPDVSLGGPIRIDLVLFPPLVIFCIYAGIQRIFQKKK